MRQHRTGAWPLCLGLVLLWGSAARALNEGEPAPSFRLPDLAGMGSYPSDSLLKLHPWTLLVVWNTGCPECMADVVKIGRHVSRADSLPFQVIGIVTDDERIGDARRLVKGTKLRFLNLWDATAATAARFKAAGYSFSSFLVDSAGTVHDIHYDHPESVDDLLERIQGKTARSPSPGAGDER